MMVIVCYLHQLEWTWEYISRELSSDDVAYCVVAILQTMNLAYLTSQVLLKESWIEREKDERNIKGKEREKKKENEIPGASISILKYIPGYLVFSQTRRRKEKRKMEMKWEGIHWPPGLLDEESQVRTSTGKANWLWYYCSVLISDEKAPLLPLLSHSLKLTLRTLSLCFLNTLKEKMKVDEEIK